MVFLIAFYFFAMLNTLILADDYAKENCFKKNKQPKRSFRASCVYSYSLPKRKRSYRATKKKGKHSRSSNKKFTDKKGVENEEKQKKEEEECGGGGGEDYDDDCELIALRLSALRSKQELKEFSPKPEQNQQIEEIEHEEELLRIDALRSALLKKKDHFMEKKLTRKLEKEKPYSPTDDLDKILDDDAVELTPPRMQSPQDDINQMDMEISNSPILHEQTFVNQEENDNEEEERVLRSMLLSSISNKRKAEEKNVAINLKLAVERLRQAQQRQQVSVFSPPPKVPVRLQATKKSGTKTIKMLLEEKKIRKIENVSEYHAQIEAENVLLNKITNEQNEKIESLPTPLVEDIMAAAENNILLPTISDTKNIPLLSKDTDYNIRGTKKSRVLTSLVKHNVKPLIINVNAESSDDDVGDPSQHENNDGSKNTHRKIIRVNDSKVTMKTIVDPQHQQHIDIIEKQVENLLRKIRLQSENQPSKSIVRNTAVNHLPRSSQIEYAMLMEKMRILEETKIIRRQLKRQKSSSNDAIKNDTNQAENLKKKFATEKVEDTLSKVQLLNETARERFAFNAENKYLDHSNSLKSTTEDLIKLVRANSLNILRRQKVDVKIAELEKQLAKFRSMKKVLEHRINTGIPQIIRSQMTLIKLRNHQHNFGNMCLRVGKIIRGPGYRYLTSMISSTRIYFSFKP